MPPPPIFPDNYLKVDTIADSLYNALQTAIYRLQSCPYNVHATEDLRDICDIYKKAKRTQEMATRPEEPNKGIS